MFQVSSESLGELLLLPRHAHRARPLVQGEILLASRDGTQATSNDSWKGPPSRGRLAFYCATSVGGGAFHPRRHSPAAFPSPHQFLHILDAGGRLDPRECLLKVLDALQGCTGLGSIRRSDARCRLSGRNEKHGRGRPVQLGEAALESSSRWTEDR